MNINFSTEKIWQNSHQITPSFKGRSFLWTNSQDTFVKTSKPKKQKLDRNSTACRFFGVDSPINILNNSRHQELLNKMNKTWQVNDKKGEIVTAHGVYEIDDTDEIIDSLNKKRKNNLSFFESLKIKGAGKITFRDNMFGKNILGGTHTIGLVYKDDYLYVLDSLGENTVGLKKFHSKIKDVFSNNGFENIIFSTKNQQSFNEYSCNNWTFANIQTLLQQIHTTKEQIKTTSQLNKVLREDINNILNEQYKNIINKMG